MREETEEEETIEETIEVEIEEKDQDHTEKMMGEKNLLLLLEILDIEHLKEQLKNSLEIAGISMMLELLNKMERVKDFVTLILKVEKRWIKRYRRSKEQSWMGDKLKLMRVTREEEALVGVIAEAVEETEEVSEEEIEMVDTEEEEIMIIK